MKALLFPGLFLNDSWLCTFQDFNTNLLYLFKVVFFLQIRKRGNRAVRVSPEG